MAPNETRLSEQPSGEDALRDRGVELLAALAATPPLPRAAFARVRARLSERQSQPGFRLSWRTAAAAVALAVGLDLGVALARMGWQRWAQRSAPVAIALPPAAAVVPAQAVPVPSLEVVAPKPVPAAEERGASSPAHKAAVALPPGDAEAELFESALGKLRRQSDPAGALVQLDKYLRLFPRGVFRDEARVARVDAQLALGNDRAALVGLDSFADDDFRGAPRAAELRLLRGELLAKGHRCAEALSAFEPALELTERGEVYERALYGRAVCRGQLLDLPGSRADFQRYLEAYPRGRFAAAARLSLGSL